MLRIGKLNIPPLYTKIVVFIFLFPAIFYILCISTWHFTKDDFNESLTNEYIRYYETQKIYGNEKEYEQNYQDKFRKKKKDDKFFYQVLIILYIPIALTIIIVTDRKLRNTQAGIIVAQYIKWEMVENLFKPKAREYEIKDLEHEEKISDFEHKKRMKDLEYLAPLALINFNNAKTEIEKARAAILKDAVNCMYKMSDRWRAYVYSSVMGGAGSPREDADLQDEINRIKLEIELEALRTKKMENDERQRKHDANKRPPPDV